MIVKRFGCIAIHNKALYKCFIHSFIHSFICGIRTYVKLGNTEVGLHRAQLPCFIFKKHSQLLQASSAGVQGEMTRGWLLSTEDPLPFNSLKKKWAGKNGRSVRKVRASHAT